MRPSIPGIPLGLAHPVEGMPARRGVRSGGGGGGGGHRVREQGGWLEDGRSRQGRLRVIYEADMSHAGVGRGRYRWRG